MIRFDLNYIPVRLQRSSMVVLAYANRLDLALKVANLPMDMDNLLEVSVVQCLTCDAISLKHAREMQGLVSDFVEEEDLEPEPAPVTAPRADQRPYWM
jgi:hypothetical protein